MNTTQKGERFELLFRDYLENLIESGVFPVAKNHKIFVQKPYFSEIRESYIKFDVTVEEYIEGFEEFSRIIVFECKDYKSNVDIGKIDEFESKCQHIGRLRCKAVFVCTSDLSNSALNTLHKYGMGFIKFDAANNEFKLTLPQVKSKSSIYDTLSTIHNDTQKNHFNKTYFQYGSQNFINPHHFFMKLLDIQSPIRNYFKKIPYISHDQLECISLDILKSQKYTNGSFDVSKLLDTMAENLGYSVVYTSKFNPYFQAYIDFNLKVIKFFISDNSDLKTGRFTIAHELSHIILKHDQYLNCDYLYDSEIIFNCQGISYLERLEYQANYLVSCLLLPKPNILSEIEILTTNIKNRGFGKIYVDNQSCNLQPYLNIINKISTTFEVSRSVVAFRLKSLGLISDSRLGNSL